MEQLTVNIHYYNITTTQIIKTQCRLQRYQISFQDFRAALEGYALVQCSTNDINLSVHDGIKYDTTIL